MHFLVLSGYRATANFAHQCKPNISFEFHLFSVLYQLYTVLKRKNTTLNTYMYISNGVCKSVYAIENDFFCNRDIVVVNMFKVVKNTSPLAKNGAPHGERA